MTDHPINLREWQVLAAVESRLAVLVVPMRVMPGTTLDHITEWTPGPDGLGSIGHVPLDRLVPPLIVGGRYWCRETWAPDPADGAPLWKARGSEPFDPADKPIRWRSPVTMPRRMSRITIVPTEVRVCRLHDVTEDEAAHVGLEVSPNSGIDLATGRPVPGYWATLSDGRRIGGTLGARLVLRALWNDQHGPGAYERNPWCAVGRAAVHLCNIDTLEATR